MTRLILLVLCLVAAACQHAPVDRAGKDAGRSPEDTNYGFGDLGRYTNMAGGHFKKLAHSRYTLRLLRTVPDDHHWQMGLFAFRHEGSAPIQLYGFGFEKDGSFRVRFERFSKYSDGKWAVVPVLNCATGAQTYELKPGTDYVFQIPLQPFEESGEQGVVLLGGEAIVIFSEPFDVAKLRSKS